MAKGSRANLERLLRFGSEKQLQMVHSSQSSTQLHKNNWPEFGFEFLVALGLALYQLGAEQMNLPHNFWVGLACWTVAMGFVARMFWIFPLWDERLSRLKKIIISAALLIIFIVCLWTPVKTAYVASRSSLVTPEELQRREILVNELRSEYIYEHGEEVRKAYPQGGDVSGFPVPTGWINHRLYEIHEPWAIGIPNEMLTMSSKQLLSETAHICKEMRDIQAWHDRAYEENYRLNIGKSTWDKNDEHLHTEFQQKYGKIQGRATHIRDELLRRVGLPENITLQSQVPFDSTILGGVNPLGEGAEFLEELANKLQD